MAYFYSVLHRSIASFIWVLLFLDWSTSSALRWFPTFVVMSFNYKRPRRRISSSSGSIVRGSKCVLGHWRMRILVTASVAEASKYMSHQPLPRSSASVACWMLVMQSRMRSLQSRGDVHSC